MKHQQTQLVRYDVDVIDQEPASIVTATEERRRERQRRRQKFSDLLDAIYASDYGSQEKALWQRLWDEQRDNWLLMQDSRHTRAAYARSIREFEAFLATRYGIDHLWLVEPDHVVAWIQHMRDTGSAIDERTRSYSDRTINLRLAAVSSFFQYMTGATKLVNGDQIGLFVSADGHPRQNPCRATILDGKRPQVTPYDQSRPIPTEAMQWIIDTLAAKKNKTVADYRDLALLLAFYRTGYRADSVLRMQWGHFSPKVNGEGMIYHWAGKGGKREDKAVPPRVWNAVVAYLRADGRYIPGVPMDPEMYIWQSIRKHGNRNLLRQRLVQRGVDETNVDAVIDAMPEIRNRPISQSTATEALRRHLKRYMLHILRRQGIRGAAARIEAEEWAKEYHLHSLRHTFANELDRASNRDIRLVSTLLNHSSLETTRIYLAKIADPEDQATALLEAAFGM